jgi:hypothetical protein
MCVYLLSKVSPLCSQFFRLLLAQASDIKVVVWFSNCQMGECDHPAWFLLAKAFRLEAEKEKGNKRGKRGF